MTVSNRNMGKLKTYFKGILYGEGLKSVFALYLLNLAASMTMRTVYSFLPKMVKHFGATEVH